MPLIVTDQFGNSFSLTIDATDNNSVLASAVQNVTPSTNDNSVTIKALDLIASSLRLIGVQASGESVAIADANDSLMVLQHMIDSWNADPSAIFTTRSDDYQLQIGKQDYTLGSGGDFDTNRPARIDSMSVILLSNPSNPIEIPIPVIGVDDWQNKFPVKTVNGSFPVVCYDDGGFPLRTLSVWPIPLEANTLRVYSEQPIGVPLTLQTYLHYPPGYARAIRYNLAVDLAPEFDTVASAGVLTIANSSLAVIKSANAPDLTLQSDIVPANSGGARQRAEQFGLGY